MSSIDHAAARRLAWLLKTLLGLEAIITLVIFAYGTVIEDSEVLDNPHKAKIDKSPSHCRRPWPGRIYVMWNGGCFIVKYKYFWSGGRILVRSKKGF